MLAGKRVGFCTTSEACGCEVLPSGSFPWDSDLLCWRPAVSLLVWRVAKWRLKNNSRNSGRLSLILWLRVIYIERQWTISHVKCWYAVILFRNSRRPQLYAFCCELAGLLQCPAADEHCLNMANCLKYQSLVSKALQKKWRRFCLPDGSIDCAAAKGLLGACWIVLFILL